VNWALVWIEGVDEIVADRRPLALARLIAVGARHARAAAHCFMLRIPRLVRVVLADPAGVLTARTVDHEPDVGLARERR